VILTQQPKTYWTYLNGWHRSKNHEMDSCGLKNFSNIIVRTYKEASVDFVDQTDELGSCDTSESISRALCFLVILATMFSGHETLLIIQEGLPENPVCLIKPRTQNTQLAVQAVANRSLVACCVTQIKNIWFICREFTRSECYHNATVSIWTSHARTAFYTQVS